MKVGITSAHYPEAPGASWEGQSEHPESNQWSRLLVAKLIALGIDHVWYNKIKSLKRKVNTLNEDKCDLYIEIHFNACGGCGASGSETLYFPGSDKGKSAAEIMQKHLAPAMGNTDRGAKPGWYQMDPSKGPDYFLKATNNTALIIEPEFIEHYLAIKDKREAGTSAIAAAINEYLCSDFGELPGAFGEQGQGGKTTPKPITTRKKSAKRKSKRDTDGGDISFS